jgi:hypothetical protein
MPNQGHFAQIDSNNTVSQVVTGIPIEDYSDEAGQAHINTVLGLSGTWLHTEPMARAGALLTQVPIYSAGVAGNDNGLVGPLMDNVEANRVLSAGIVIQTVTTRVPNTSGFRHNYALPGMIYNSDIDGFVHPKPDAFPSFILDSNTGMWTAPIPKLRDGHERVWDETNVQWAYVMPLSTLHTFWLSAAPDPSTGRIPSGTSVSVNLHDLRGWYTGQEIPDGILSAGQHGGMYY